MAEELKNNFMFYDGEQNYVSPAEISKTTSERIKQRQTRLGRLALLANMK